MKKISVLLIALSCMVVLAMWVTQHASANSSVSNQPSYNADGKLVVPANYRDWVFLTSGLGMNYSTGTSAHPMFTNVYVAPEAYHSFKDTGKWPDKSMFVVEIYSPATHGSINKGGHYQNSYMGLDVEVKDSSRPKEWAYYNFDRGETTASELGGGCNKCHTENAAVEHTFVQFYPTLLDFAVDKNLIKPGVSVPLNESRFGKLIKDSGWEKAEQAFYEDKKKNPESDLMDDHTLGMLAGSLFQEKKLKESFALMTLITKQYPTLAWPYDDMAQNYQETSQPELSLEASRKELAVIEKDSTLSDGQKKRLREAAEKRIAELSKK